MKVIQRTRFKLNKFITDSIMLALVFDLRLWTFGLEIDILLQEITLSIGPFHFSIERWATMPTFSRFTVGPIIWRSSESFEPEREYWPGRDELSLDKDREPDV
jgi:hypothetical protein